MLLLLALQQLLVLLVTAPTFIFAITCTAGDAISTTSLATSTTPNTTTIIKIFMLLPETAVEHPLYKGYYVTPDGEVWSTKMKIPKKLSSYRLNTKVTYQCVGGSFNGKNKVYVHRLVAETFLPNPHNLTDVNHINGDKTDNRVCNLEWISREDNIRHAWDTGLMARSGAKRKYVWSVMICATGEIFETTSLISLERAFGLTSRRLTTDYRKNIKKPITPLKIISRRVLDQP